MSYRKYLEMTRLPHTWCAGCGNGMILGGILRTFDEQGLDPTKVVVVTGIGCWGKADDYIHTNAFHGSHGRALAYATGIKLAKPELKVVVLMGDGDGVTIGGNHFIHAARRNVDLTAIIANNFNYGMTGGQYSGTTPEESITVTSPYGHVEPGFDICNLAQAAGAKYVARVSADSIHILKKYIEKGMQKPGFAVIEAITPCPTYYGRNNGMRTTPEMLRWIRSSSVSVAAAAKLGPEELEGKFIMGEFVDAPSKDYGQKYRQIIDMAGGGSANG